MPNFSQPIEGSFVVATIVAIFVLIGVGILLVKKFK